MNIKNKKVENNDNKVEEKIVKKVVKKKIKQKKIFLLELPLLIQLLIIL